MFCLQQVLYLRPIGEEEDASLDEDNLTSSIISEVLEDGNADDETDQDSTNSATVNVNPNQDQTIDQDNVSEFGYDTGDLGSINVDVPIAIPINLDIIEEEEPPTPTPPIDDGLPAEDVLFCIKSREGTVCFDTLADCEFFRADFELPSQCEREETLPPDASFCAIVNGRLICEIRPV
jgi:hypothetical protein